MKKIIFALLCLSIVVLAEEQKVTRLSVFSPPELVEKIKEFNKLKSKADETSIECELANFGSVQYGTRTIGEVHVSNPYNACNKTEIMKKEEEFQRIPFLLVERGSCAFADKVYNAQEAGANIVIIVDNSGSKNNVIMIDNGHGYNVHITSVFITKQYGDIIKKFIDDNPDKRVNLSLELIQKRVDQSIVRLWIDPASPFSTKMVSSFYPIRKDISDNKFITEPVFDIQKNNKVNSKDSNCIPFRNNSLQFCSPDPDQPQEAGQITNKHNVATGADSIRESIRQLCIHKQSEDLWYQYYIAFGNECYFAPQYYDTCSTIIQKKIQNIDTKELSECIGDEFQVIKLLEYQAAQNSQYQIFEWPAVTINDLLYRGNLEGNNVAEAVCNSIEVVDEKCEAILDPSFTPKQQEQSSSSGIFLTLVLVVLGFTVAFFITAYAYKRIVRREISQDVDQKVNQMVSQYIAFYESRGKNTGDQSDL